MRKPYYPIPATFRGSSYDLLSSDEDDYRLTTFGISTRVG